MAIPFIRSRSGATSAIAFGAGLLCAHLAGFIRQDTEKASTDILRVRGIVIVDEAGRERILIGAPIPEVAHRIRTDMTKVEEAWGDRFSDFEWFKRLNHTTTGMLILDENGHDRIAVGDPMPDPNIGRRIAPSSGLVINDELGFERSGWGYFPSRNSVGFGLDRRSGEGLNLVVSKDTSGILLRDEKGSYRTFLGNAEAGFFATGLDEPFQGLIGSRAGEHRFLIGVTGDDSGVRTRDATGATTGRLPGR